MRRPGSHQADEGANGDAASTNTGLAPHDLRVKADAFKDLRHVGSVPGNTNNGKRSVASRQR